MIGRKIVKDTTKKNNKNSIRKPKVWAVEIFYGGKGIQYYYRS